MHEHKRAIVNQREVGVDTASFASALRAALRGDPDVLLVGEMRDLESIQTALTIAETGHLVLASLHTNDTSQALARIIDVFPADQQAQVRTQLAAALTGIMYQRLIPRVGGGLVAAHEVLIANTAVRNLIKEGKTHQLRNAVVTGQREGMLTFEQSLSILVDDGRHQLRGRGRPQPLPTRRRAPVPDGGGGGVKLTSRARHAADPSASPSPSPKGQAARIEPRRPSDLTVQARRHPHRRAPGRPPAWPGPTRSWRR